MRIGLPARSCALVTLTAGVLGLFAAPAAAEVATPSWTLTSVSTPTNFNPAAKRGENYYRVLLTNSGAAPTQGPVTITDELPKGLFIDPKGATGINTATEVLNEEFSARLSHFNCSGSTCTYNSMVIPDQVLEIEFPVDLTPEAQKLSPLTNIVRVSGGGAAATSLSVPTVISETPAKFGIAPGGASTAFSSAQAGAHPDITTSYNFTSANAGGALAGNPKDITYLLPPGFASDFADTPACSNAQFIKENCPIDSQVGITTVEVLANTYPPGPDPEKYHPFIEPVYNLAPEAGTLAAFGFVIGGNFFLQGQITLRHNDYGATITFHNIDDALRSIAGGSLTVWGVPADPRHNAFRRQPEALGAWNQSDNGVFPYPYFTAPTSCGEAPIHSEFQVNSWEESERISAVQIPYGPRVGCDSLLFTPQMETQPSADSTESPTGLNVIFQIPQFYENSYGTVAPNLDDVKVLLPEGMTLNPSAGAGLVGCSEAEYAYEKEVVEPEAGRGCPRESKLGSVHVRSPGVSEEAVGSLFLGEPAPRGESGKNPFNSLVAVYLVARIPNRGVVVTAPGKVEPNKETGQITATFDENPQLPFGKLTFTFHQGATSPLVTPPTCGSFTSEAVLTPWSVPTQEFMLTSFFEITSGILGGPCPAGGVPPFNPSVISGTKDNDASAYSPFYLRIIRQDGEQEITKFSTTLPPGLTGNLSGIPFCPNANIEQSRTVTGTEELEHPSCPGSSEIGHTIVEAGVGSVLAQTPGKLYLAGPYHGSSLSVVSITAAKVGPFDLGTVVIRFALRINPATAQVEIDGSTSDPIPHIIDGIVVHVRDIRVYVSREGFIINPTSCNPMSISDTIVGAGANYTNPADQVPVSVSTPFQAADCSSLTFKPDFKVSVSGKNIRTDGVNFTATVSYPNAPLGSQANISKFRVELPKQLPSRLTTLQKACRSIVFDANPAECPPASLIGHAKAITPILPEPLIGPAYFVSNGTAKFPELVMVLQGYSITIVLRGETFISREGITSTTLDAVPDEPIGFFELTFPSGPDSVLTAIGNLCKSKLVMPTEIVSQSGVGIRQNTAISTGGCKATKATRKHHKKHSKGKKGMKARKSDRRRANDRHRT
jgi:hypothetical protein